ncbi:MAG TPA: tetratricopeptide repeat protein [Roseiarcus sp.]|jgi:hypothetical protein
MSDIFHEVDEEVRRDKAAEFWKKHQNLIIAAAVLLVIGAGGWRFYQNHQIAAADAAGAAFQQALALDHDGKGAAADAALAKLAGDAPHGYQTLARLAQAAIKSKTDPKAAIAAYDALANDASIGAEFEQAARLRAALLRLDAGQTDAAKSALEGLATNDGVYRNTARLSLAVLALKAGDYDGAGKSLDLVVADPTAPETERSSAERLLGLVASNRPVKK